jgi:ribose transport system substrate-binding protein
MKKMIILLPLLCLAVLLQSCDNRGQGAKAAPQKQLRLAFVANNANDYWSIVRLGCDASVRQLGNVDLHFRTPADRTAAAQQEIIRQLIAAGLDGIAVSPIDAEQQTEFLNTIPANVLLVCADSDAPRSRRLCYIGTDNVAAGKQAAGLLKAALPQGGKIALFVGHPSALNIADRVEGIKAGLAGSNLEIVETIADEFKAAVAQKNAAEALARHPDLAGMAGLNSYTGPAILEAVRSAGKNGQVKIVCFDEESDTLTAIAAGDIFGTVVQRSYRIGQQTVAAMGAYLRGDKTQLAGGKILLPTRVVTRDSVADFQTELKNILEK